jgi:hypothetical protein
VYIYPLKFKAGRFPADDAMTILDAKNNELFFRLKITEPMEKGKTPCDIFTDKKASKSMYTTLKQKKGEVENYLIKASDGSTLGELVAESEHSWKVMDEHDNLVANIQEKSHWKNSCLFEILTFPFDQNDKDTYLKFLSPHRYIVTLNGKKVFQLREEVSAIRDDYSLKKFGEFSEHNEVLVVISLMMTLSTKI